ncbi:hypothetical protein [Pontimicrobium sp. SW4]|uniref:Protein BatD n=1 Tax=Pontimicrobium sp. SW4 TaxID=3153519 RepID=A0AAU7BTN2_9FLAO
MQLNTIYILLFTLMISSSSNVAKETTTEVSSFKLLTKQIQFEAGSDVVLKISATNSAQPPLYCTNSYGSILISPSITNNILQYEIPKHISNKIGKVYWKLLIENDELSGQINIAPKKEVATMETYIGPPSIEAGGIDYAMLVVIPTDVLDNPLPKNTIVNTKYQFLSNEIIEEVKTEHLIAYKNIYSKQESGRILASSECLNTNSKEFTINVFPAIPTNFTITFKQPHNYADGNQITTFETSVIKDKQNNIVSDGTYVEFFITNEKGNRLKTSGTTINGIATARMIHPDYSAQWQIKAFIDGIAESNIIAVNYKQVITDFNVVFSKNNRLITIGPLQSFMKQLIPDGLQVKLNIYKNDILLDVINKKSIDGYVHFNLKPDLFENDEYTFIIKTAEIEKPFNMISLW